MLLRASHRIVPAVSAGTVMICMATGIAGQTTVDLVPVADVFVTTASPATNFNFLPNLSVGAIQSTTGGTALYRTLIRFDLDGVLPAGAEIQKAVLRLSVFADSSPTDPPPPAPVKIHANSGSWGETAATWNNQPAIAATPAVQADPPL